MTGPLSGLRVLDLSTTFSGPYCTNLLSDLGADVIKVEAPGGDVTRSLGTTVRPDMASVFIGANRNKDCLLLNLREPADKQIFDDLARVADVLVHNMREQALTKLGIDYGSVREHNPGIVYCAVTGYGTDGPYAGQPAYDDTIQAMSGMAWLQSQGGQDSRFMFSPVADKTAGVMAALAINAALVHRARTGEGQHVEVPMFETLVSWNLMEQLGGRAYDPAIGPTGYERLHHRRPYRTSDGVITVVCYHGGHWQRFLEFVDQADLLEHDDFREPEVRAMNIGKLYALVEGIMPTRSTDEWLEILKELDIPATRLLSTEDLFDDEHLRSVDMFQTMLAADGSSYLGVRSPILYEKTPTVEPRRMAAPQHLDEGRAAIGRWLDEPSEWATDRS